ncbi:TetR/AcrR family transcriptional regulator [Aerococcaceae bacterium NML160702]|nr:TetR/AcrR family transcriptional regulator [Aerococcaceae bacterium NML160702]
MTQQRKTDTKQDIKRALTTLLQEKSFDAITVSDITRYAQINRGTFYLHYLDKFDLLEQLMADIYADIGQLLLINQSKDAYYAPLLQVFHIIKQDFDFIYALTMRRPDEVDKSMRQFLMKLIEQADELRTVLEHHPVLPADYATEFFLSSSIGVILHWVKKGAKESPEQLAKMLIEAQLLANVGQRSDKDETPKKI